MAGERLSMRKIKEVLRHKFDNHLSVRQIAESCGIGKSTVQEYFDRAQKANLTWPLAPGNMIFLSLERKGAKIPVNDVWISACSMEVGGTLLTRDKHFTLVDHDQIDVMLL